MRRLPGACRGEQVVQTVASTSLFICLCLGAVSCSKGGSDASAEFRPTSVTVGDEEISFEHRTFGTPIPVGASLKKQGKDSAHGVWLLAYHYRASGEYERIVDLAVDTDQAKNYVANLESQPRQKNEKSLKRALAQQMVGEVRVGDRYLVLMTKPKEDGSRELTGQCAVKTPGGFQIVAVPYYLRDDFGVLFDVLEALKAEEWELDRGP